MRQSNFELLRITAMLLVLAVHANFWVLGEPTAAQLQSAPLATATRLVLESAALVCVNVFVMISGWFGIRPTVRGFCRFVGTCLFYSAGFYAAVVVLGKDTLTLGGVIDNTLLLGRLWFVWAYLILYLISPLLNRLIASCSTRALGCIVAGYLILETATGWIWECGVFLSGYSAASFAGLYLLAAWMRRLSLRRAAAWLYPAAVAANALLMAALMLGGAENLDIATAYSNPLTIAASAGLLIFFAEMKMPSYRTINVVASSAFAVYLIHTNLYVEPWFRSLFTWLYADISGPACLTAFAFTIVAVFFFCIGVDKFRLILLRLASGLIMPQRA